MISSTGVAAHARLLRVALSIGVACLIAARIPTVWPHGRLWAEEGVVYLASAWTRPGLQALVTVHTGYMNLPASGMATLAVHSVALEYVPLVTVLAALLIQVLPAVLLAVSGIRWLDDWRVLALALLIVIMPPYSEEVWLNTITSQFHIMLAVAVILASVPGGSAVAWFQGSVLLLAPLCGPGGAMLLPMFVLRSWLDKSSRRLRQALLLLPGALVQVGLVLTHPEPARSVGTKLPLVLAAITGKQILLPLLGPQGADWLTRDLPAMFAAGHMPVMAVVAPVAVFGALGVVAWQTQDGATRWLFAAGMVITAVCYFAVLTPNGPQDLLSVGFGGRYYFVPTVLAGLTLLGIAATGPRTGQIVGKLAVAWLLLIGLICYPHVMQMMARGPDWRREVAAWRDDPKRPIAIWPSGWEVHLAPKP